MADLERAERIKALREERHLTQPAVADEVGVTLRAYQGWEATGALRWDNATKLAEFFGIDPHELWSGRPAGTPALLHAIDGGRDTSIHRRIDEIAASQERIEQNQLDILARVSAIAEYLASVESEAAHARTQASDRRSSPPAGRSRSGADVRAR